MEVSAYNRHPLSSHSDAKSRLCNGNRALSLFGCFLIPESTSRSTGSRLKFGYQLADAIRIPILPPPSSLTSRSLDRVKILGLLSALLPGARSFICLHIKKREKKRLQDRFRISYVIKICLIAFCPRKRRISGLLCYLPASCENGFHFHKMSRPGLPGLRGHD